MATETYAVLDGAAIPGLLDKLYGMRPEFACLYPGQLEPDMAEVAPYLVRLVPDSEFTAWAAPLAADSAGILVESAADFPALRRHLRRFTTVYTEEGDPVRFRFYDPRVLSVYLPTCNDGELAEFFGPVQAFVLPAHGGAFALAGGKLRVEARP